MTKIEAVKGFDKDFRCRGFQFEVGKTYQITGKVEACHNGFHAIPVDEHPFHVWDHYHVVTGNGELTRYATTLHGGDIKKEDTKIASAEINIKAEITLPDFIKKGIDFVLSKADWKNSKVSNTGNQSVAQNTGNHSVAQNTGNQSVAQNTGDYSVAQNTGDYSVAQNTGYHSVAQNTGDYSVAQNTGNQSVAQNTGRFGAAFNTGFFGKVSGAEGNSLHLDERIYNPEGDDHGKIIAVWAGIVGQNGIKPDTLYTLKDGVPVAAE